MKWIDVTLPMAVDTVHWPGHPQYTITNMIEMEKGEVMNVTAFSMCSHFGTHIDAPRHYVNDGKSIDAIPTGLLVGPCKLVFYEGDQHIDRDYIKALDLQDVKRLFIRTKNSEFLKLQKFNEGFIGLLPSSAEELVKAGVNLLGVDGYSIGPYDPDLSVSTHQIFLGGGPNQTAIEEVDLQNVDPGDYEMIALPLKLKGLEASPTRVLLGKK